MLLGFAKKAVLGLSILLGASALATWQVGCSGNERTASTAGESSGGHGAVSASGVAGNDTGTIGLALVLPGGDQISSVTYTLKNSSNVVVNLPTAANPGTFATNNSQSIEVQIGGVPAGSGYTISLAATTLAGATCHGSATGVTITSRASTTRHDPASLQLSRHRSGQPLRRGDDELLRHLDGALERQQWQRGLHRTNRDAERDGGGGGTE